MEKGNSSRSVADRPLSPSMLDLQSKIQHSFINEIDKDGDGVVTPAELLSAYDTDHSGELGKNELARLAQQLSAQTHDNNNLLAELQRLEQQQLKNQKEVQAKQDALRKALGNALGNARGKKTMKALRKKKSEKKKTPAKKGTMKRRIKIRSGTLKK